MVYNVYFFPFFFSTYPLLGQIIGQFKLTLLGEGEIEKQETKMKKKIEKISGIFKLWDEIPFLPLKNQKYILSRII